MIDFETVNNLLQYNPITGLLRLRVEGYGRKLGGVAGNLDKKGYLEISIKGKGYRSHRLIWLLVFRRFPEQQIDHINQNKSDNRLVNLRVVNNRENHKNMRLYSNNTSGICGVHWSRKDSIWVSGIMSLDGEISKSFKSLLDAVCFRKSLEIKFGYHENHGKQFV